MIEPSSDPLLSIMKSMIDHPDTFTKEDVQAVLTSAVERITILQRAITAKDSGATLSSGEQAGTAPPEPKGGA